MEERGDVHSALAEMERKLGELQRELMGEGPAEEGLAPRGLQPAAAPPAETHLRAGPFADIESLGRFEQALRALDGVEEVVLRGFEADRALFDVRLAARR